MAQLQDISALSWRTTSQGKVILSFPKEPTVKADNLNDDQNYTAFTILNTKDRKTPVPSSYFPTKILGYLSFDDDEERLPHLQEDTTNLEALECEVGMSFPYSQHHTCDQHAIFLQRSLHEEQKGSHA